MPWGRGSMTSSRGKRLRCAATLGGSLWDRGPVGGRAGPSGSRLRGGAVAEAGGDEPPAHAAEPGAEHAVARGGHAGRAGSGGLARGTARHAPATERQRSFARDGRVGRPQRGGGGQRHRGHPLAGRVVRRRRPDLVRPGRSQRRDGPDDERPVRPQVHEQRPLVRVARQGVPVPRRRPDPDGRLVLLGGQHGPARSEGDRQPPRWRRRPPHAGPPGRGHV